MSYKELSPEHQKFIDAFIKNKGKAMDAAKEAGFAETHGYYLVRSLRKEIIEAAENILALHSVKAAFALADGLDTDAPPMSTQMLECAKTILDRVGIVKKEKVEISGGETPLFILPAKKPTDVDDGTDKDSA